MSQNIVNAIISTVTPALAEKVGSAIGISPELARKGLAAVLPAVLGLIASRAATPTGVNQLFGVLETADQGIGSNLLKHLAGPAHNEISASGSDALASLAGDKEASTLVETIARFTGTSGTAASALAGIGTQLVTGQLAKMCATQGLDPAGLASMLAGSKGAIQAALPAGLGTLLAGTGSFGQAFTAVASAAKAAPGAVPPKPAIATGAPRNSPIANMLVWLIPVALVAAGAGWYYLSGQPAKEAAPAEQPAASSEQAPAPAQAPAASTETAQAPAQPAESTTAATAQQPAAATTTAEQPAAAQPEAPKPAETAAKPATSEPAVTAEAPAPSELGKPLVEAFATATKALGTVVDDKSAKAALPAIETLQKLLESSSAATSMLSAEQKTALVKEVQPALASFKAMAEKGMDGPGVKEVLKPAVDALLAKAASFPG